jgi:hypothetical protein
MAGCMVLGMKYVIYHRQKKIKWSHSQEILQEKSENT